MPKAHKTVIVFLFIALTLLGCTKESPKLRAGRVDLGKWDFHSHIVELNGEWEFYWGQLLTPSDFKKMLKPEFAKVPMAWRRFGSATGCATYRAVVKVPPHDSYGLSCNKIETAYQFWVNGEKKHTVGRPGKSYETAIPQYLSTNIYFPAESGQIEIVIQVSNFRHFQSGILNPIKLGRGDNITHHNSFLKTINFFIISSFLITALFNFTLYGYRKGKSTLFFALFCLSFGLYVLLLIEKAHIQLFPNLDWEIHVKIIYFTFLYMAILYLFYLRELFPQDTKGIVVRGLFICTSIIALIILVTNARVHMKTVATSYLLLAGATLYSLFILGKALKNKRPGALAQAVPCFAFFVTIINDTLHSARIIQTGRLIPIGILFFVIWQFVFMGRRFAITLSRKEILSDELEEANAELEKSNDRLEQTNADLEKSKAELEKSNVQLAGLLEGCNLEVGKIVANLERIVYIKSNGHHCHLRVLRSKTIDLEMLLKDIPTRIRDTQFIRVHKSYLANLRAIEKIVRTRNSNFEIVFTDTRYRIPVSRHRVVPIRKKYPNLFE